MKNDQYEEENIFVNKMKKIKNLFMLFINHVIIF